MITLTVVSHNGQPAESGPSAQFDELGGTVGRAEGNQLVLPDPERRISRIHVQVVFRNGAYAVIDRGSNPILHNGQALGHGTEQALADGDQLQIGDYVLAVQLRQGPPGSGNQADDPFADLLGPGAAALAAGAASAALAPDPLAAPKPTAALAAAGSGHSTRPGAPYNPAPAPAAASGIPDDWDPFASMARSVGATPQRTDPLGMAPGALGLDLGAAAPAGLVPDLAGGQAPSTDSLDALFGLTPGSGQQDPLAGSLLQEAAAQPNMSGHADPMRALQSAPRASGATAADALSDLNRPFQAAPVRPAATQAPVPAPASGAVLSWDQPAERPTVIPPVARAAEPAPAPAEPAPAAGSDGLLEALREGLGLRDLPARRLTPDLLRLVGQLLREATGGTVDLLLARAALKREVRAEATLIVANGNNPLKFSPGAEAALQLLLAPSTHGFMPPEQAMRDAFHDLRAHQFGMVAGMRAALAGVLARFDPAELENQLAQRSRLQAMLPGGRKAALWDLFLEHFGQISAEAEDDFHSLFGRAFLQAYEDHIAQLREPGGQGS